MLLPAHSHRDSDLDEPLVWALEHHFASIEADVWWVNGDLRIGHERSDAISGRTLESVYLDRIFREARLGQIAETVTLLVDIKNAPSRVYGTIHNQLRPYADMLTRLDHGEVVPGSVRVVLSGERPIELAAQDANRLVFLDGRLPDIGADPRLFPTVSLDWPKMFDWNGEGAIPSHVEQCVRGLVEQTHAAGQTLRFWGTCEDPAMWSTLLNLGVDLINCDDVVAMTEFLARRYPAEPSH
ncbi:MAG: hypothetical protein P4L46_01430 [Fimbriimonas sp.]|nr:hypothetical protein [Fimbriimonas sp.]